MGGHVALAGGLGGISHPLEHLCEQKMLAQTGGLTPHGLLLEAQRLCKSIVLQAQRRRGRQGVGVVNIEPGRSLPDGQGLVDAAHGSQQTSDRDVRGRVPPVGIGETFRQRERRAGIVGGLAVRDADLEEFPGFGKTVRRPVEQRPAAFGPGGIAGGF